MSAPSGPSNAAHVLNLAPPAHQPMTSSTRSPASPPRTTSVKPSSPQSYPTLSAQVGQITNLSPRTGPKTSLEVRDHTMASPPPPPKLPEAPVSPKNPAASSSLVATQAPAQLALMLSNALADVEALKKSLAEEKRRTARAERLLQSFKPNGENGVSDEQKKEPLSATALQAVLDAESRAERAERTRDDALHALHSLTVHFAELERYESSLSLRASDARGAFTRLLTNITTSHPPPASSPTLTGSPPTLALPSLPAPLQAPSLTAAASQYLPGAQPPSLTFSRHTRGPPAHATSSFNYSSHSHQPSYQQASQFSGLPLPPPPSASGLGSGLSSAPPPSSSTSFSVPAKRSHRSRSMRGLDDAAEPGTWDDAKRRRVGPWDMDVDRSHPDHAEQPLPYPQHQPPLSAQPTQRIYEREHERLRPQQNYARNGADANSAIPTNANGMVRVDARDLVRDAKERDRRERGLYQKKDVETSRRRRRSASRSSAGSSWSIDEMLLETATDGGRERREDGQPSPTSHDHAGSGAISAHVHPMGLPQPCSNGRTRDEHTRKVGSHSSQLSNGSVVGVNGSAPTEREKTGKVPASNLVTLGPDGVVVSGGGQAVAPLPGGGFPAYNAAGQRICRQCGVPGRYKEGKCVEKWGPGPEGPGTVCDRCRKKMKRVERRGTIDSAMATAQHQAFLAQRQSQAQLQAQPSLPLTPSHDQPSNRSGVHLRADTLLLDPHSQNQTESIMRSLSQQHAYSHERGRERPRDRSSQGGSSRSHSPAPAHQSSGTVRQGQAHSHGQGSRRAPTPPYINSISTREQENEADGDEDAEGNDADSGEVDVDVELARAAEGGTALGKSRETSRSITFSSSSSLSSNASLRAQNGTTARQPRSSSRASASSTNTAYERRGRSKSSKSAVDRGTHAKHMALSSVAALQGGSRRRDTLDDLNEDDGDADAEEDGPGDGDPDAEIMDAVDATMKVEE